MQKNNSDKTSEKRGARILIVDDERDIREIMKKGLEQNGYRVETSGNPEEVLANYQPGNFDLLLLDIRMPGMNGFELYREIRKIDPKVKVCFVTAFEIYYDEFKRVFPKIHVSCFINKPITIVQLSKLIAEELARAPTEEPKQAPKQPIS